MRFNFPILLFFSCFLLISTAGLTAQVATAITVEPQQHDNSTVISIRWEEVALKKWNESNEGHLEIPGLKTNIHSTSLLRSGSSTTSFQFDLPTDALIELLVEDINLVSGEKLQLISRDKKVVFDFSKAGFKRVLSPAFDPATTSLVWTCPEGAEYRSTFLIDKVYYQLVTSQRGRGIGFGTALPCHPNAACKQDSMTELIANSAVRMRMVMEEGIGWCTGAFINTTRNDKTPYLLSAYHCQYDYTPLYDMWRFDLQYKSTTCDNPDNEPSFTSLTGCSLISSGQESDFLLVLLDEQVPVNQNVTFAGWDRDNDAKPDTSYLIHHPNADIRKISTCVNEATIHPNEIGWTEGYSTPGFHHFRMKFTEGGHQPGSSGGPLFNEEGLLVGQLHGGTSGCESINNTYIGRFTKSWSLGSTAQHRLGDWLDPDQTGLMKVASLPNISSSESITIRGVVRSPQGEPVKNVVVKITGAVEQEITTGADGVFELKGVNRNGTYTITSEKLDNPTNGLNALDLVGIQKHLLGKDTFDLNWQFVAADATNNDDLSVGDIVLILRLLLGKISVLPTSPSWQFDPPQIVIDPDFADDPANLEIMGIKIGDVNGTVNPQQ